MCLGTAIANICAGTQCSNVLVRVMHNVLIGGIEKTDVLVVDYDPLWPEKFVHHAGIIRKARTWLSNVERKDAGLSWRKGHSHLRL